MARSGQPQRKEQEFANADTLTAGTSFWIGASINLIGMPFAIPYFAVLGQILKADLDWLPALMVLLIYNLLYIFPFSLLILIRFIYRQESDALFKSISDGMEQLSATLMPLLLFLHGWCIVGRCLCFFLNRQTTFLRSSGLESTASSPPHNFMAYSVYAPVQCAKLFFWRYSA